MKLFSSKIQKEWDEFTIQYEPVSSVDLMARAANSIFKRLVKTLQADQKIIILCGSGNNGGDGLVLAKLLRDAFFSVEVWYFPISKPSPENLFYLASVRKIIEIKITEISPEHDFPTLPASAVLIDAITGYGFKRPWRNGWEKSIKKLNQFTHKKIAIDLPSGMDEDCETPYDFTLKATSTYTIQLPKRCFFYEHGHAAIGTWEVVPIGLQERFYQNQETKHFTIDVHSVLPFVKKRPVFSAKWTHGHAALVNGSTLMPGAALLAGEACLRSGVGLLTSYLPISIVHVLSSRIPESLLQISGTEYWSDTITLSDKISAVGLGPGLGLHETTKKCVRQFLLENSYLPKVIDADAINIMHEFPKEWPEWVGQAILTPHQKECERLFGPFTSQENLEAKALEVAFSSQAIIVLKGAFSRVCLPDGRLYYNTTGNAGMAKGGFGDVLTGILTGLLAQGYTREQAALLGVYIHGLAGDLAALENSKIGVLPSDLLQFLPRAWKSIESSSIGLD